MVQPRRRCNRRGDTAARSAIDVFLYRTGVVHALIQLQLIVTWPRHGLPPIRSMSSPMLTPYDCGPCRHLFAVNRVGQVTLGLRRPSLDNPAVRSILTTCCLVSCTATTGLSLLCEIAVPILSNSPARASPPARCRAGSHGPGPGPDGHDGPWPRSRHQCRIPSVPVRSKVAWTVAVADTRLG